MRSRRAFDSLRFAAHNIDELAMIAGLMAIALHGTSGHNHQGARRCQRLEIALPKWPEETGAELVLLPLREICATQGVILEVFLAGHVRSTARTTHC